MNMFEQHMKEYQDVLEPVVYLKQMVRDPSIALEQTVDQLIVYKHGFFITPEQTVVEICPTVSSGDRLSILGNRVIIGVKVIINGDEVLSFKEVPLMDVWIDFRDNTIIEFVSNMVLLGYLKPGYDRTKIIYLLGKCYQTLGKIYHTLCSEWVFIPFSDGTWNKKDENEYVYWCMRKYNGKDYITKYCKSPHYKHLECPNSKIVISEISKEVSPVTFEEAFQILS